MKCILTPLPLHPCLRPQPSTQGIPSRSLSTTPVPGTPIKATPRDLGHLMDKDNPLRMLPLKPSPRWLALTLRNHGRTHILRIQNIPTLNRMLQSLRHLHVPGTLKILPLGSAIIQRVQRDLNTPTTPAPVISMRKSLMAVTEERALRMSRRRGSHLDTCLLKTRGMGTPLLNRLL